MKYLISDKIIKFTGYSSVMMILVIIASSCNPTKYVPDGESLLDENHVNINRENVKNSDVVPYIKQKPNKRIFGTRFHLGLYNLSNIKKEKWPHNWLRNIGEEPAIFDPDATLRSKEQIGSYLSSKGYFDAVVMETIETAGKKSNVYFNIDLKPPYTVKDIYYEIADTVIAGIVLPYAVNCLIEKGKPYDVDVLQAERSRVERMVRNFGFYNFSGEHINFRVDSTIGNRQVNIYYSIKKYLRIDQNNRPVLTSHSQYKLRNIYIYPDYIPKEVLAGGEDYFKSLDTTFYNGFYFISHIKKPSVKYNVIIQSLYIKPGGTFHLTNTERSHNHLMSLKTYRLVNILYNEPSISYSKPNATRVLDQTIQLTPMSRQSFSVELEGTNSGGNLGGAINFIYQNKNLFRGAEQFNIKLKAAYDAFSAVQTGIRTTREFGVETSLRLPKFLVPFLEKEEFIKKYNPSTSFQVAYNYQDLPVYTRTVANATFGYVWNEGNYRTHMVNPLQMNLLKIPTIDSAYYEDVIAKSSYLINSYKDVMISELSYSFIYSTQKIKKARHYWFVRFNAEASGNLLWAFKKLTGAEMTTDTATNASYYNIFGQPFSQFIRTDIDIRYNRIINDVSSIVYRTFAGVGIPYKNSLAMPFEKQYYEGGANGIRGWLVRALGPGSYAPVDSTYIYQTGDIKLEFNLEYRFKLFWILEGAVFVDAGNIWAIKNDVDRPGAQFKFNKFLNDFAIGAGVGMRFDLKFVILRTDLGFKIRDPKYSHDERWITSRPTQGRQDMALVIAIGYPF